MGLLEEKMARYVAAYHLDECFSLGMQPKKLALQEGETTNIFYFGGKAWQGQEGSKGRCRSTFDLQERPSLAL